MNENEVRELLAGITPGEWTCEDFSQEKEEYQQWLQPAFSNGGFMVMCNDDCNDHPIADCSCNASCRGSKECEFNARFIAAAPDIARAYLEKCDENIALQHELARKTIEKQICS